MKGKGSVCPPLGVHVSAAGGIWKAVERACDLGCTAMQLFTQSPGRWTGPELTDDAITRFRETALATGILGTSFVHAPYLINVASGDEALRRRSLDLLVDQLDRARRLGVAGVVLHPGAHGGDGVDRGLGRAAATIMKALERTPGAPRLLIEVTAGQGTVLGRSWNEIARLLAALPEERCGVCWDTAHLWGAGYDVASREGWERTWAGFQRATGLGPALVHLNDTNVELGSHRDRHERIGYGALGVATFARIVRDPRLASTPMILETPKGPPNSGWDREALHLLRSFC
ncbi:MAG: deoxyribonuclease IV [Nitrospiraceae bacterium]|nr:deoxyribonuclease IV [Nitrospiraceae bacterium]